MSEVRGEIFMACNGGIWDLMFRGSHACRDEWDVGIMEYMDEHTEESLCPQLAGEVYDAVWNGGKTSVVLGDHDASLSGIIYDSIKGLI